MVNTVVRNRDIIYINRNIYYSHSKISYNEVSDLFVLIEGLCLMDVRSILFLIFSRSYNTQAEC